MSIFDQATVALWVEDAYLVKVIPKLLPTSIAINNTNIVGITYQELNACYNAKIESSSFPFEQKLL